ncbi:MAG: EpsI family protein [Pyrinomonadaceae bacterium]|nr:EpsI family protein [Pyrinomonadaceae bacterium]
MKTKLKEIMSWRFGLLLAVLLLGGVFINLWERAGEARVERRPLKEFPAQLGDWRQLGEDLRFIPEVENILRADDYVSRTYALPSGGTVSVYIGYYATQRTGVTYHSPQNCLPGSGWTMYDPQRLNIASADGSRTFEVNRYVVQNGDDRQLLIYWYQGRGRAVASEYWDKFYTVMDSARRRRSDGAMVRLMTSTAISDAAALELARDLSARVSVALPAFVPD